MPFEIDYTPLGSVFNLSYQAGLGQYRLAQQEMAQRQQMQQQALQANLNSQAIAHANNLEEMHLQEQMQNRAAMRQADIGVRLAQVQNDLQIKGENRKFANEMALQQAQFANEAIWKGKDIAFKEQQELAKNMEKLRIFRAEEAKLQARGMQYDEKGLADLNAWQAEWDSIKGKNLNPLQASYAYGELIARKPLPKSPPPPSPQEQFEKSIVEDPATGNRVVPIYDEKGNVKAYQNLGTMEGDQFGGGGAGGSSAGGGTSTRAVNRGAGNIWTRFLRKANPADYKEAVGAISKDVSAWNDLRNHAYARLEDEREAKIKGMSKGTGTTTGPDGQPTIASTEVPEITEGDITKRMHDILKSAFDFNDTKAIEFNDLYKKIGGAEKVAPVTTPIPNARGYLYGERDEKMSGAEFDAWLKSDTKNVGKKFGPLIGNDGNLWDFVWDGEKLVQYEPSKAAPAAPGQQSPATGAAPVGTAPAGTAPATPTPGGLGPRRIMPEAPPLPPITANDLFPVTNGAMPEQPWFAMPSMSDLAAAYGLGGGQASIPGPGPAQMTPQMDQQMIPSAPQFPPQGPPQYAPGVTMGPDGRLTYNNAGPPVQDPFFPGRTYNNAAGVEGTGIYLRNGMGQQYNATAGLGGDLARGLSPSGLASYWAAVGRGFVGWTERQTKSINAKVDKLNRAIDRSAPVKEINRLKREVNEAASEYSAKAKADAQTKPLEEAIDKVMGRILNPNS